MRQHEKAARHSDPATRDRRSLGGYAKGSDKKIGARHLSRIFGSSGSRLRASVIITRPQWDAEDEFNRAINPVGRNEGAGAPADKCAFASATLPRALDFQYFGNDGVLNWRLDVAIRHGAAKLASHVTSSIAAIMTRYDACKIPQF